MPKIEVIATDGRIQRRIIWISINSNGIYCDIIYEGMDRHMSLHKDGSFWATFDGNPKKEFQIEPLDKLKRRFQLVSFGFIPDITQIVTPDYIMNKLDSVIFVDTRTYVKNKPSRLYITCNIDLIEPKNYQLLEGIEKFGGEIHIYTQFKQIVPWIVISIY